MYSGWTKEGFLFLRGRSVSSRVSGLLGATLSKELLGSDETFGVKDSTGNDETVSRLTTQVDTETGDYHRQYLTR